MSSQETEISLKQRIKNQECRTVTNDYLCDDCVLRVVKEWLKQKKQHYHEKDWSYHLACSDRLFDELIKELES